MSAESRDVLKTYIVASFIDTHEIIEIAKAAERIGYHGIGIPEHVVNLAELDTPYPYSRDGQRRWPAFTHWPDPCVLIGALGNCTSRLRLLTTVYVASLHNPYQAAKSIGTAALLSQGRMELGLGVGWCREEFALLGQEFRGRGRRTEEMIELMRKLWQPGWTSFEGEHYRTPTLEMSPTPPPVPILFGGHTDIAINRAAAYDGWISGDALTVEQAIDVAGRIRHQRAQLDRQDAEFSVISVLADALTPGDFERAAAGGVTHALTQPWLYYYGANATLDQKIDGLERYHRDFMPTATEAPSNV